MSDTPSPSLDRLYDLVPYVYRLRDSEQGWPLRSLLRVIAGQVNGIEADIAQLYEDWFIETSQDWVVPYIGDLVGYHLAYSAGEPGVNDTDPGREKILIPRRDVSNTIRYRRRKGTLAVLELLSRDAAGWPARAVEFYRLLSFTQSINHLHLDRGRTVDLRQNDTLQRLDGPFDELAHSVDVRRITSRRTTGRYNIPNVGVFVWRLRAYSVTQTPAFCVDESSNCYTFSILGNNTPLFAHPQAEPDPTTIATEPNLPVPIRRRALELHKDDYYGLDKSFVIWDSNPFQDPPPAPIDPARLIVADLSGWEYRPAPTTVAIDPELGRMVFPATGAPEEVWVSYYYGFSADIGGGEYTRPILEPAVVMRFTAHDVKDSTALANEMKSLPSGLLERLPQTLRDALADYDGTAPPADALQADMLAALNELRVEGCAYDEDAANLATLRQETIDLIPLALNGDLQGDALEHFNRLFLEDILPQGIAKSYLYYAVGRDQLINDALRQWGQDRPRNAVIEIIDSGVFEEQITVQMAPYQTLHLRAANARRPVISLVNRRRSRLDALVVKGTASSHFTMDGLLIVGRAMRIQGEMAEVNIRHSTLVPGWDITEDCRPSQPTEPSLELFNSGARVRIEHSILGTIQVTQNAVETEPIALQISDSILDATDPTTEALGAPTWPLAHAVLTIVRSTVIGYIQCHAIDLAENSIFYGTILVGRRQRGCMRFCSYVSPGSRVPRRYQCQPDLVEAATLDAYRRRHTGDLPALLELARLHVRPQFNSLHYGTPTYCQLAPGCAEEIRQGADDQAEMGVFHNLYQPQRAANLRARLDEFAPIDAEIGIIYAS